MKEEGLVEYFEHFLENNTIFKKKLVLQSHYAPNTITHRDEQINAVAKILAPTLRGEQTSNLFIYGKTGTGKTLVVKHTTEKLLHIAQQRDIKVKVVYVNCKLKRVADTEYRLLAQLARSFGKEIPATGLPTDEVYNVFYEVIDSTRCINILVLDEIDQLMERAGNDILYNLTRINSELKESRISLVGISNDLSFTDKLDPRVKSSLSEEELVFPPYNALQIQDILRRRSDLAFHENVLEPGLIEKCSAYAAREHGDARRALELLRVAGEIAERECQQQVLIAHLDKAEQKIENDRVYHIVRTYPKQSQVILYAILCLHLKKRELFFTGEIYELYEYLCKKLNFRPLTQRRVSDVLSELDMLGLIRARIISKGRYGRMREISLSIGETILPLIKKTLEESLGL
ncbi:ORC1-type DNA replication protein [Candidatus Woesearchaeota archaeon]|nr:ORC1-type DNA replication protein [Candidatus Woesearchaeota archaeon]